MERCKVQTKTICMAPSSNPKTREDREKVENLGRERV